MRTSPETFEEWYANTLDRFKPEEIIANPGVARAYACNRAWLFVVSMDHVSPLSPSDALDMFTAQAKINLKESAYLTRVENQRLRAEFTIDQDAREMEWRVRNGFVGVDFSSQQRGRYPFVSGPIDGFNFGSAPLQHPEAIVSDSQYRTAFMKKAFIACERWMDPTMLAVMKKEDMGPTLTWNESKASLDGYKSRAQVQRNQRNAAIDYDIHHFFREGGSRTLNAQRDIKGI